MNKAKDPCVAFGVRFLHSWADDSCNTKETKEIGIGDCVCVCVCVCVCGEWYTGKDMCRCYIYSVIDVLQI